MGRRHQISLNVSNIKYENLLNVALGAIDHTEKQVQTDWIDGANR